MDTTQGIQNIEHAAAQIKRVLETPFDESMKNCKLIIFPLLILLMLFLLLGSRQMLAIKEKLETYHLHCGNFCSRFYEYMRMMFQYQVRYM